MPYYKLFPLILFFLFPFPGTQLKTPGNIVKTAGNYELHIWCLQPGTRSQGLHGGLLKDGKWFFPAEETILHTPLGDLKYFGDWDKRTHSWDESGWLPEADLAKISETCLK